MVLLFSYYSYLQELYVTSTKRQKMSISRSIVDAVRSLDPPGRFLEKDVSSGIWFDIGDKKAVEKTSQALRDGAACLRKQLSEDLTDPDFLRAVFDDDIERFPVADKKVKPVKGKKPAKLHRRTNSSPGASMTIPKETKEDIPKKRRSSDLLMHSSPKSSRPSPPPMSSVSLITSGDLVVSMPPRHNRNKSAGAIPNNVSSNPSTDFDGDQWIFASGDLNFGEIEPEPHHPGSVHPFYIGSTPPQASPVSFNYARSPPSQSPRGRSFSPHCFGSDGSTPRSHGFGLPRKRSRVAVWPCPSDQVSKSAGSQEHAEWGHPSFLPPPMAHHGRRTAKTTHPLQKSSVSTTPPRETYRDRQHVPITPSPDTCKSLANTNGYKNDSQHSNRVSSTVDEDLLDLDIEPLGLDIESPFNSKHEDMMDSFTDFSDHMLSMPLSPTFY